MITDYDSLVAEVQAYLLRSDADTVARIPTWIQLFEASANRRLRTVSNIARKTNTTLAEYIALPVDWREGVKLTVEANGRNWPVAFNSPLQSDKTSVELRPSGVPDYYSVIGESLRFIPPPDGSYTVEMVYWATLPALDGTTQTTNWMLQDNPDAYLFGTLVEGTLYVQEDERLPAWQSKLDRAWLEIETAGARAEWMGPMEAPAARTFY